MGLVSITQLANGTTADATAVDTNFNNIANQLNGNIDSTNLAAGAAAANLTDASTNPSVLQDSSDRIANYVKPGTGILAISSGLIGTFSNITYYISGKRYTASTIANKTYTASKDTYVDIDTTGTVTYTEATNGAASPALAANNLRVAKVVTGASITSIVQTGQDSLGNAIHLTGPVGASAFGGSEIISFWATSWSGITSATYATAGTNGTYTFTPTNTIKVFIQVLGYYTTNTTGTGMNHQILVDGSVLTPQVYIAPGAQTISQATPFYWLGYTASLSAGVSHTLLFQVASQGAGTFAGSAAITLTKSAP